MKTLVLNAGFEPLEMVGWQKAICLVLIGKAEVVAEHSDVIRTVSRQFPLPSIVRLKRYVQGVKRFGRAKCNRKNIFLRDNFRCQYCGEDLTLTTGTIDHVHPRSEGGRTEWENVVAACINCNRKKGSSLIGKNGFTLLAPPKAPTRMELFKPIIDPAIIEWFDVMGIFKKK